MVTQAEYLFLAWDSFNLLFSMNNPQLLAHWQTIYL